jgi:NADPH:quinone reductase-like Zn-dependent oxidoreductase
MKRLLKIFGVLALVTALALAVAISHDSACPDSLPALAAGATPMKAARFHCYGGPEVVHVEDAAKPVPARDEVLVRVHAAGLNPLDWHYMRGVPYLMRLSGGFGRPKDPTMGVDFAGVVEAVGQDVTRFKPGDRVFGAKGGALAEYVAVSETRNVLPKPERISFEQAAGVGVAAVTALQALRDQGELKAGQKVLVNGASGGVGTFAVQIAKALGAQVTGVCSTRNVELVRSIGADRVVDYTQEDFTQGTERYDLVVDMVGNHSFGKIRRVLEPTGRYVIVGANSDGRWLGGLTTALEAVAASRFAKQDAVFFIAKMRPEDLAFLAGLTADGKLTPVVDRVYPLADVAEAITYLETGRARGKVVVSVVPAEAAEPPG